jgi:hypothetical protein
MAGVSESVTRGATRPGRLLALLALLLAGCRAPAAPRPPSACLESEGAVDPQCVLLSPTDCARLAPPDLVQRTDLLLAARAVAEGACRDGVGNATSVIVTAHPDATVVELEMPDPGRPPAGEWRPVRGDQPVVLRVFSSRPGDPRVYWEGVVYRPPDR